MKPNMSSNNWLIGLADGKGEVRKIRPVHISLRKMDIYNPRRPLFEKGAILMEKLAEKDKAAIMPK